MVDVLQCESSLKIDISLPQSANEVESGKSGQQEVYPDDTDEQGWLAWTMDGYE